MEKITGSFILIIFLSVLHFSCQQDPLKKKVLYINSYHPGYGSSDDITRDIRKNIDTSVIDLKILYMNTKRNQGETFLARKSRVIIDEINHYQPDIIVASGDNAVKYIVIPYLKNEPVPVIFCGVNWSAENSGLPNDHVTGMLEILPVKEGMHLARKHFPAVKKVFILSKHSESEQKNTGFITAILQEEGRKANYKLVKNFEAWEDALQQGNEEYDLIYLPANGAIQGWDDRQAMHLIKKTVKVPVLTYYDFMMPYCLFGVSKIQEEQGIWAARTAMSALQGGGIPEITLTRNTQINVYLNSKMTDILGFRPNEELLSQSKQYTYK